MERKKIVSVMIAVIIVTVLAGVIRFGVLAKIGLDPPGGLPRGYVDVIWNEDQGIWSSYALPSLGWVEIIFIFIWGFILQKKMRLIKYGPFPPMSLLLGLFLGLTVYWTIPILMIFSVFVLIFLIWPIITEKIFNPRSSNKVVATIGDLLYLVDESGMDDLNNRNLSILAGLCFGLGLVRGGLSYGFILYLFLWVIVLIAFGTKKPVKEV